MSETTTTEWKSAFSLNPPQLDTSSAQTIAKSNGIYYWIVTSEQPEKISSDLYGSLNGFNSCYCYELTDSSWVEISDSDLPFFQVIDGLYYINFPKSSIVAQSWNDAELHTTFYPREHFDSRIVPAPVGNAFDSIYTNNVLDEVLALLPVVLLFLAGFIGIRKAIRYLSNLLKRG